MRGKKIITGVLTCAMIMSVGVISASACHGHSRSGYSYSLCTYEGCNVTTSHTHDGVTWLGHYVGDGHDYHQYCDQYGCSQLGGHGAHHNGYYY